MVGGSVAGFIFKYMAERAKDRQEQFKMMMKRHKAQEKAKVEAGPPRPEPIQGTKRQAEARMVELIHQVDGGGYVKPGSSTVGAYLQQWLEDYARTHVRATTLEGYRARAKHLISGLGSIRLSELRPDHLQAYYSAKLQNGRRDGQ